MRMAGFYPDPIAYVFKKLMCMMNRFALVEIIDSGGPVQ